jgi:hypothetical protein
MSPTVLIAILVVAAFVLWQIWAIFAAVKWLLLLGLIGLGVYLARRFIRRAR